jgi:hypothetical protein
MINLNIYEKSFDTLYPAYSESRYAEIQRLIKIYDSDYVLRSVESPHFLKFIELLKPLISIKNYKSQVPFPEELHDVISCIIKIRQVTPSPADIFLNHQTLFNQLISIQGFQLPTVSAVFHFCHPNHFPIVDRNVVSACELLNRTFPNDFNGMQLPSLPALNTSVENKLKKYAAFIAFINMIVELQRPHLEGANYRYIDKALMVFGVPNMRVKAEQP